MATLVYRYGVIKGPTGPVQSAMDQIRLAHQYRNELVALELSRRAEVDAALAEFSPELAGVEAEIGLPATDADPEAGVPAAPATGLVLQLEQLDARAMAARADSRSRAPSDPALQAELRDVRARLKDLRARRKELRAALFADAAWEQRNAEVEERPCAMRQPGGSTAGTEFRRAEPARRLAPRPLAGKASNEQACSTVDTGCKAAGQARRANNRGLVAGTYERRSPSRGPARRPCSRG